MDIRHLRRPIHLILDWDGTLTRKDTLALVGQIAYQFHQTNQNNPTSLPPWSDFSAAWMNDYFHHASTYKPKTAARTTLDQERHWLASLAPIESRSVRRVEASGIFKQLSTRHVDQTAQTVIKNGDLQLRGNWHVLIQRLLFSTNSQNRFSILSVNWSERFIRQSLLAAANALSVSNSAEELSSYIETMDIRANEITGLDSPQGSDGTLNRGTSAGIRTSADKLANMPPSCRQRLDGHDQTQIHDEYTVVYVGDSATDLEALLAADVGICMRDEPMGSSQRELAETLTRIGVRVVHVGDDVAQHEAGQRVVYWASGFDQIAKALAVV